MNTELMWQIRSTSSDETQRLGELLGRGLVPPQLVELRSDLGGGKTTLVRGLAAGLESKDTVSSPTFTLKNIYHCAKGIDIHHFDFYRLDEAGVLKDQLKESLKAQKVITIIEWSDMVKDVLPSERLTVELKPVATDAEERDILVHYTPKTEAIVRQVETDWRQVRP